MPWIPGKKSPVISTATCGPFSGGNGAGACPSAVCRAICASGQRRKSCAEHGGARSEGQHRCNAPSPIRPAAMTGNPVSSAPRGTSDQSHRFALRCVAASRRPLFPRRRFVGLLCELVGVNPRQLDAHCPLRASEVRDRPPSGEPSISTALTVPVWVGSSPRLQATASARAPQDKLDA